MDLGVYGLGSGKLLVRAGLAQQALDALRWRCRVAGLLNRSNIVVSAELKPILLEQVKRLAPRANPIVRSEVLELGPRLLEKRSFAAATAESSTSVTATNSSTDAHVGP